MSCAVALAITSWAGISVPAAFAFDDARAAVEQVRKPVTAWPGPIDPVNPPSGKTIYVVTCSSQGIGCVRAARGVEQAGAALGWKVRVIDGRGDPAAWNGAILSAISANADGLVLDAVPPMLVGDALQRAAAAKLPVVSVFNPKPDQAGSIFAYVRPDHGIQGRFAASWVAADSGGKARILIVEDRQFPELLERTVSFRDEIRKCGGCEIVETVESTIGTMAQRLPGAVASALGRNRDIGYVVAPFDSNAFFVAEGVRQSGRAGSVKVAAYEGDPQAIDAIRNGQQTMSIADPAEWMGWQAVDELARALAGQKPANVLVRFRLIDRENAPQTRGWLGDLDYQRQFKTLWGVK